MTNILKTAAIAGALTLFGGAAYAECKTDIAKDDLTDAQATELFQCIEGELLASYQKSGRAEADAYRGWYVNNTNVFISSTHGNRFVNHYVNDIGKAAYSTYAEEGQDMPVGSITAKESFTISKKNGSVRKGPLFLMEKMGSGFEATAGWKYAVILPNGKIMGETGAETDKKVKFCHDCHEAVVEGQDAMFYPDEDYRVGAD